MQFRGRHLKTVIEEMGHLSGMKTSFTQGVCPRRTNTIEIQCALASQYKI